jgi:hypothetical protein
LKNPHPNLLPVGEGTTLTVERVEEQSETSYSLPLGETHA